MTAAELEHLKEPLTSLSNLVSHVIEPTQEMTDQQILPGDFIYQHDGTINSATFSLSKNYKGLAEAAEKYTLKVYGQTADEEAKELKVANAEEAMQQLTNVWGCPTDSVKYLLFPQLNNVAEYLAFGYFFDGQFVDDQEKGNMLNLRVLTVDVDEAEQPIINLDRLPYLSYKEDIYGIVLKALSRCIKEKMVASIQEVPSLKGKVARIAARLPFYFPKAATAVDYGFTQFKKGILELNLAQGKAVQALSVEWKNRAEGGPLGPSQIVAWQWPKSEMKAGRIVSTSNYEIVNRFLPTEELASKIETIIHDERDKLKEQEKGELIESLETERRRGEQTDILCVPISTWNSMVTSETPYELIKIGDKELGCINIGKIKTVSEYAFLVDLKAARQGKVRLDKLFREHRGAIRPLLIGEPGMSQIVKDFKNRYKIKAPFIDFV
jgi:hypothetical protein